MEANLHETERKASGCPFHAATRRPLLAHADELYFPMNKRVIAQYSADSSGSAELHLYYGDKEISFDEPELFAFGEQLAQQSRFAAGEATAWGAGYEWPRVRELLEQLIEEGVLQRADAGTPAPIASHDAAGPRPSPLPPALTNVPRTWVECEAITKELTGQALELGYLELIVPVFRVAHIALDSDGRQVGEANVFPKPLRLDVPTRWRTCIYPGSRYLDDKPMNVTALKAMRTYWGQMMVALRRIREAYLERFPAARNGFTVGDVERIATLVLAVPTYQLMRSAGAVANGELHPALSCLFRVTDGLRMTTHQMLFVPVAEATVLPDTPVCAADIYAYAERNQSFHSTHGVCAGPKAMIEEFLGVVVDGVPAKETAAVALEPPVEAALADMQAAFDYGLYGLQAHAVVFSLWPVMTRTYAQLAEIADGWSAERNDTVERLSRYLGATMEILQNETLHATEAWRANRQRVYVDIYEQCARGLGLEVEKTLDEYIAAAPALHHAAAANRLRAILRRQCYDRAPLDDRDSERLALCLMNYFIQAQAIVRLATEVQRCINTLLNRAQPTRAFNANDVDVHVLLQGTEARRLPYLLKELEGLLGFRVEITQDSIEITETDTCAASSTRPSCATAFVDMGLAN